MALDRQWRALMARATERLDLTEVHEALEGWRRVAWVTSSAYSLNVMRPARGSIHEPSSTVPSAFIAALSAVSTSALKVIMEAC